MGRGDPLPVFYQPKKKKYIMGQYLDRQGLKAVLQAFKEKIAKVVPPDGSVTEAKIADKAVTKDKLADGAVVKSLGYTPMKGVNSNYTEGITTVTKEGDDMLSVGMAGGISLGKDNNGAVIPIAKDGYNVIFDGFEISDDSEGDDFPIYTILPKDYTPDTKYPGKYASVIIPGQKKLKTLEHVFDDSNILHSFMARYNNATSSYTTATNQSKMEQWQFSMFDDASKSEGEAAEGSPVVIIRSTDWMYSQWNTTRVNGMFGIATAPTLPENFTPNGGYKSYSTDPDIIGFNPSTGDLETKGTVTAYTLEASNFGDEMIANIQSLLGDNEAFKEVLSRLDAIEAALKAKR